MFKKFAYNITSFLIEESIINDEDREIYHFGTEQVLLNCSILVLIGIIAFSIDLGIQTFFWLSGMLPIRAVAGGYHASTQNKCNILTLTVYVINMFVIGLIADYMTTGLTILIFSIILMCLVFLAPVDHKNKVLDENETLIAKIKSRVIGLALFAFSMLMIFIFGSKNIYSISITIGALTATISLVIGSYMRGGER